MLSKNCKFVVAITTAAGATGTSVLTSAAIDTLGFDGCLVLIPLGPITSGAATSCKLQQSSDDAATDAYSDLLGSSQTIVDDEDGGMRYLDILRPQKRYLKVVVSRGTQAATIGGVLVILYDAGNRPTTHPAGVVGETMFAIAEGTA